MNINGIEFTFGADPEVFLRDRATGKMKTAFNVVPGTKDNPHPVKKGAIQRDCLAAEFNINPAKNESTFVDNIISVRHALLTSVLESGYELVFSPSVTFDKDVIDELPDFVTEFGCSPDFNAYTGEVNPTPIPPKNKGFAVAGGHIHIGWTEDESPMDEEHFTACRNLAKQLDLYVGLPSVWEDKDRARRTLYGKAGAFRPKPYGMEYRVVSNYWVAGERNIQRMFRRTTKAIQTLFNNAGDASDWSFEGLHVPELINTADKSGINKSDLKLTWEGHFN